MARKNSLEFSSDAEAAIREANAISNVVRFFLKYSGTTQEDLAQAMGISRASLNQILGSRTTSRLYRLPHLCAIARVMSTNLADLFAIAHDFNELINHLQNGELIMKDLSTLISREVARRMTLLGLSQGRLARRSGVSQGTISMNLKGDRGWSIDVLERLCPHLGARVWELLFSSEQAAAEARKAGELEKRRREIAAEKAAVKARWEELRKEEESLRECQK